MREANRSCDSLSIALRPATPPKGSLRDGNLHGLYPPGLRFCDDRDMKVEYNELGSQIRIATPTTPFSSKMKMNLKESLGFTVFSLLLPCALLGLQAGCTTHPSTAAKLQRLRLQGKWEGVMVGQEKDGKITITITGNSLHFHGDTTFGLRRHLHCLEAQAQNSSAPLSKIVRIRIASAKWF